MTSLGLSLILRRRGQRQKRQADRNNSQDELCRPARDVIDYHSNVLSSYRLFAGSRNAVWLVSRWFALVMDRGSVLRVWVPLVGGLWGLGMLFQYGPGPRGVVRSIGLSLGLVGLAGVIVSRYTLGRSFSVAPKATALVTRGIYSRIRNPIYLSGMILVTGLVLIVGRIEGLAVLLVLIPMQMVRARREAAVLEGKFRDAYREYRKRTWF